MRTPVWYILCILYYDIMSDHIVLHRGIPNYIMKRVPQVGVLQLSFRLFAPTQRETRSDSLL